MKEQTTSVRGCGHPDSGSPRYGVVSCLSSFILRETGNLYSINVAEGGVAMESVTVGTGSSLIPIRAVGDSCSAVISVGGYGWRSLCGRR